MIDWFQRQKLVKKGLACDKTRRQRNEEGWSPFLEANVTVRLLLFCFFLLAFFTLDYWGSDHKTNEDYLLTSIIFFSSIMLLHLDLPDLWPSNSKLFLVFSSIWTNLAITKALFIWAPLASSHLPELLFMVPTAFAPLVLSVLLGPRAGLFGVLFVSLFNGLFIDHDFQLLIISLITGFTGVYFTQRIRRRGDLVNAGIAVGLASFVCAIAFGIVSGKQITALLIQAAFGIGVGIFTAMAVNSILPILEAAFHLITDISWIEMADLNHPLLQQMTMEAPGTYHHSLMVANLAEAAAITIGANPTQCRVISYFHDVGKIIKPEYFAENFHADENPHDNLSPSMSALIIIAHVKEGVDLALKARLKRPIIDAIQQHHGDSLVYYFYKRAKQMEEDAKTGGKIMNMREEDIPEVSENSFRYPGPKPQSKEVGLLMLADAIESASRTLEKPTPQKIESLVNEIIEKKITDHQLDESNLTLKEIWAAADSFIFTVKNMLHSRITYPKDEKTGSAGTSQSAKKNSPSSPPSSAAA